MRYLWAIVLVTGCVSSRPPVPPETTNDEIGDGVGEAGDTMRLVPRQCDSRVWSGVTTGVKQLQISVAPTPDGAAVFMVPATGGAIRGFLVDNRAEVAGDAVIVSDDRNYTSVAATYAAERLVIAGVGDDTVSIDLVRDDLGARFTIGGFEGTLASALPVVGARGSQIAFVGSPVGVTANPFATPAWTATSVEDITSEGIASMTATGYYDDALVAWSTDTHDCYLQRYSERSEMRRQAACEHARIAIDPARHAGTLVSEQGGNVMRSTIRIGSSVELGPQQVLADVASSPRAVFDGERTWISYLDSRGDVVLGFVDASGTLISRALEYVRPGRDSYELAVFADGLWLVVGTEQFIAAARYCALPEG